MHHTTYTSTRPATSGLRSFLPRWVTVPETMHGVLIAEGRIERLLPTGRHRIMPRRKAISWVPSIEQIHVVPGQEILTADGATVRVTAVVRLTVHDPIKLLRTLGEGWIQHLHLNAQLALRDVFTTLEVDQVLEERARLEADLTPMVRERTRQHGLTVEQIALRDLVFPGTMRSAVADVVAARLEGRAALERARGETAALRSLANAARAIETNPALLQLRLLQLMEAGTGNTFVVGTHIPAAIGVGSPPSEA